MEHPLIRLKATTGRRTVVLAMEAANTKNGPSARQTWSYWLRGKRAPNVPQLARLVALADQAGDSALSADIMRWAIDLGAQLAEEPTVVIPAAEMAAMAAEDAP